MIITGVELLGVAAAVPRAVQRVQDIHGFDIASADRFSRVTGVVERRVANEGLFVSDLILAAANKLLTDLRVERFELDAVIVVTQTADNACPGVALKISNELGLKEGHLAFDINLGCSSFPYGVATAASLLKSLGLNSALLCIGDVSSRICHPSDLSTYPLFGDAGSAVLLKNVNGSRSQLYFDLNSDGSGREDIFVESAGLSSRAPPIDLDTSNKTTAHMRLKGANVFSFAINKVPPSIGRVLQRAGVNEPDICVLHQANKKINDLIEANLSFDSCEFPRSLSEFGNTSSATIPLTIVSNYGGRELRGALLACGFGVGLSWGSVLLHLDKCYISEIIEV